jgi:methylmalonyl-CoA mutase N-terminal domain/subunit
VVDPLGGSFYVEKLTDEIEEKILNELDEIEKRGGIVEVVADGWLHKKVAAYIEAQQKQLDEGQIKVVGRNYHRAADPKMPEIAVHHYDEATGQQMRDKLAALRQRRNKSQVIKTLEALKQACRSDGNVFAACVDCARADVTEGEMRRAFTDAMGTWSAPGYM